MHAILYNLPHSLYQPKKSYKYSEWELFFSKYNTVLLSVHEGMKPICWLGSTQQEVKIFPFLLTHFLCVACIQSKQSHLLFRSDSDADRKVTSYGCECFLQNGEKEDFCSVHNSYMKFSQM